MKNHVLLLLVLQLSIGHAVLAQVEEKKKEIPSISTDDLGKKSLQARSSMNVDNNSILASTVEASSLAKMPKNISAQPEIDNPATPDSILAAEEVEIVESGGKLSISGYIDSYYFTNFNNPASRDNMGVSGVGRGFDRKVDQFALGMVQTVFTYTNEKSEAVLDLAYGPNAQYGNYGNVPTSLPAYGYQLGKDDLFSALIIKQAYFKYNVTEKLSFTLGQFGTHIGYEYIDAPLNFFYSINHTFNSGIPFYHTGLKSSYTFSDKVSLMLGVVNGFDYVQDNNRSKGLIGQLSLMPVEGLNIYFNYINTNESSADELGKTPDGNFTVYDLNGGYQVSEKFHIGYWVMFGSQRGTLGSPGTFVPADGDVISTKTWYGANLYLTYALGDIVDIGLRGEHFNNEDGARGLRNYDNVSGSFIGTSVNSFTFTTNVKLADGHLLLKPELRMDVFKKLDDTGYEQGSQQFMDANGLFTKNSQTTFGVAAIYKF
ncbi:porin [Algoriphagus lacus]|uniref:Porin n=1 Tax=Algoriphagus lacus TaxID=2056311 RepID=A0A418PPD3_9BACT|nr:porin [Algoriphagus lacus]RIW13937.1 porin [Algoriphagus lacus]